MPFTSQAPPEGDKRAIIVREYALPFLEVYAEGIPKTQGSKRSWAFIPKGQLAEAIANGDPRVVRPKAAMAEDNPEAVKGWRDIVYWAVKAALPRPWTPVDGPIRVDLRFCLPKPTSAPVRRRTWPHKKPDLDKLTRAVFDALTNAGAWRDDSRAVEMHVYKDYPGEGPNPLPRPGVLIRMWRMPEEVYPRQTPPPVKSPMMPGTEPLPGM